MNAQIIITKVNDMLKGMLREYYDSIANEIITNIYEKSSGDEMSLDKMKECIMEIKPKIVSFDCTNNQPINENKKEQPVFEPNVSSIPDRDVLVAMKRKDLQALSKIHKIPGRQKNTELIEQLMNKKVQEPLVEDVKVMKQKDPVGKVAKVSKVVVELVEEEVEPDEEEVEPEEEVVQPEELGEEEPEEEEPDEEEEADDKWDDKFFADELQEEEYEDDDE